MLPGRFHRDVARANRALRRVVGLAPRWPLAGDGSRQRGLEAATARDIRRFRARRPDPGRRAPDFVIIGAPKCATSWLRRALAGHPAIAIAGEEIEFFSSNLEMGLSAYLDRLAEGSSALDATGLAARRPYAECRLGEKSASLCVMPEARIRLMRDLMPDAKLILMIRDPVNRHWAHAKRFFGLRLFGTKGSFDPAAIPAGDLAEFFRRTKALGEYSLMLERWGGIYGGAAMLTIVLEEIARDPAAVVRQALAHIGAPADAAVEAGASLRKRRNRGPDMPMPEGVEASLLALFAPEYERLRGLLGERVLATWPLRYGP